MERHACSLQCTSSGQIVPAEVATDAVDVDRRARFVPEPALHQHRAVARAPVVVTVVRRERHAVLPPQRVATRVTCSGGARQQQQLLLLLLPHSFNGLFFPGQPGYKPVPESLDVN